MSVAGRRSLTFLIVVVLALAGALAPASPELVERTYSRGLYPRVQTVVTRLSSTVPVALLDAAVVGLVVAGVVEVFRRKRSSPRTSPWRRAARAAAWCVFGAAVLYLWFLLFWGLNYRRVPLERKLAYDSARVTRTGAFRFGSLAVDRVNGLAGSAPFSPLEIPTLAGAFAEVEHALGGARPTRLAAPKPSLLMWYFRQAAIDGMTNPFFLEIILNPDLLPFERPIVLAHEWAHLAGYAEESEANFIAWLACIRSAPAAQYSGWLSAYEQMSARLGREERQHLSRSLHPRAVADLRAGWERHARSSPAVRGAARAGYDTYLRANRVDEGIASYSAVVRLMLGTTFAPGWTPELRK